MLAEPIREVTLPAATCARAILVDTHNPTRMGVIVRRTKRKRVERSRQGSSRRISLPEPFGLAATPLVISMVVQSLPLRNSRRLRIAFPPVLAKEGAGRGKTRQRTDMPAEPIHGQSVGSLKSLGRIAARPTKRPFVRGIAQPRMAVEDIKFSHQCTDEFETARPHANGCSGGQPSALLCGHANGIRDRFRYQVGEARIVYGRQSKGHSKPLEKSQPRHNLPWQLGQFAPTSCAHGT
jgi:hypothetical protein